MPSPQPNRPSPTTPPVDFTYRYSPGAPPPLYRPCTDPTLREGEPEWLCVARKLIDGNLTVVRYISDCQAANQGRPLKYGSQIIELSDADVLLEPRDDYGFPLQLPLALVLGCVDARAPAEIVFGMEFINDVFNVRLAGNVVAQECLGSVEYALRHLVLDDDDRPSNSTDPDRAKRMRLLVSLGHEGCGAVNAAVRAFQSGKPPKSIATGALASLLGHLFFPSLILAAEALDVAAGQSTAHDPKQFVNLSRIVTYLNAAWGAHVLIERVKSEAGPIADTVGVVYGVFDPRDMHVRSVPFLPGQPSLVGSSFGRPPHDIEALRKFANRLASAVLDPTNPDTTHRLLQDRVISANLDS